MYRCESYGTADDQGTAVTHQTPANNIKPIAIIGTVYQSTISMTSLNQYQKAV